MSALKEDLGANKVGKLSAQDDIIGHFIICLRWIGWKVTIQFHHSILWFFLAFTNALVVVLTGDLCGLGKYSHKCTFTYFARNLHSKFEQRNSWKKHIDEELLLLSQNFKSVSVIKTLAVVHRFLGHLCEYYGLPLCTKFQNLHECLGCANFSEIETKYFVIQSSSLFRFYISFFLPVEALAEKVPKSEKGKELLRNQWWHQSGQ